MVNTVQVGISDLVCVGTAVPALGTHSTAAAAGLSAHISLITYTFILQPTGPQSHHAPPLWAWSPTETSSTSPPRVPPRHSLSSWSAVTACCAMVQGEPRNPAAGDLWSSLQCGTVNKLHSVILVLLTERCFVAWISSSLLCKKKKKNFLKITAI